MSLHSRLPPLAGVVFKGANMSVYLENLILMAEELAFDQETVDLLGA